jgi:hypothetical protein
MNSTFHKKDFVLSPESTSFLSERYNEIVQADSEWRKYKGSVLSKADPIDFSRNNEWKEGEHYNYLESHVKSHMVSSDKMGAKCEISMFGQDITVFIVYPLLKGVSLKTISKKKQTTYYESVLRKVYIFLWIANKYRTKECSTQLNIYLYFTDLPKLLNNEAVIGRTHVNTGFTLACSSKNEIYIFREEEWFKVFIHEVFHAFGIDFADSRLTPTQQLCQDRIHRIFKLPHVNILVFEAFTELCAEMMNLLFLMYFTSASKTTSVRKMTTLPSGAFSPAQMSLWLKNEMEFSAFQCAKVLDHYSMEYTDLYTQSPYAIEKRREYTENTNVLSYYVLKPILLNHFNAFIHWIIHSNGGSFKFLTNSRNTDAFCNLIENNYDNVEYVAKMDMYSNWIRKHKRENNIETKTLRMTMYE